MDDNRGEAYLYNPLSKTVMLLKLLPNTADILLNWLGNVKSAIYEKSG